MQQAQQQQRSGQKRTTRNAMPTVRRGAASRGVCYDLIKCQRQISVKVGQTQCSQVAAAPERTKTKENCELPTGDCRLETASWQLATANCELPTAEPNSHQFFFGQSVAGFELWLDLTSLFLGSTAIFLLVFLSNLLLLLFLVSFWLFCRQTGAWLLRMRVSQNWPNVYKRL